MVATAPTQRAQSCLLLCCVMSAIITPAMATKFKSTPSSTGIIADEKSFALLVIDMQNAFAVGQPAAQIKNVTGRVNELISLMRSYGHTQKAHVFYTQHGYYNGSSCDGHRAYKRHWESRGFSDCSSMIIGTKGYELIAGLQQPRASEPVLHKEVYDAFHESNLHSMLQEKGVDTVAIAGWDSNVCCDSTARSAFAYDYEVIFLSDGTSTSDGAQVHQHAVWNMNNIAADAMTCRQFAARINATLQR